MGNQVFGARRSWRCLDSRGRGSVTAGGPYGLARTAPRVRARLPSIARPDQQHGQRYGLSHATVTKWQTHQMADPDDNRSCAERVELSRQHGPDTGRGPTPYAATLNARVSPIPHHPNRASRRGKLTEKITGYVHIDVSGRCLPQGKLNMALAIDRVSR